MSWNFREADQRDQIADLKESLSVKETKCAQLEDQLLRRNTEFQEIKKSFEESLQKLRHEADRALKFEDDLSRRSEDLQNEKLARANAEASLLSVKEQIKTEITTGKELQAIIARLSQGADGSLAEQRKLSEEKAKLEARVRHLESEVRRLDFVPPTPAPTRTPKRPRSSSLTNLRVTTLEHDLAEVRAEADACRVELESTKERLSKAQLDAMRSQNENTAMEKKMRAREQELQESLDEREEELSFLRSQHGGTGEREQELLERLEDEERKVEMLEKQLSASCNTSALKRSLEHARMELAHEKSRRTEMEEGEAELVREKEEALDELECLREDMAAATASLQAKDLRIRELEFLQRDLNSQLDASTENMRNIQSQLIQISNQSDVGSTTRITTSESAGIDEDSVVRMLSAIERLRTERDTLRRDMEFAQLESHCDLEVHKQKLQTAELNLAALQEKTRLTKLEVDPKHALPSEVEAQQLWLKEEVLRLQLVTTALALSVNHVCSVRDALAQDLGVAEATKVQQRNQIVALQDRVTKSDQETDDQLAIAQREVANTTSKLSEATQRLQGVQDRCDSLEAELAEKQVNLERSENELTDARENVHKLSVKAENAAELEYHLATSSSALAHAEEEQSVLKEQVALLQSKLEASQRHLTDIEERCHDLQASHLSGVSGDDTVNVLKEQIDALEMRVLRRTEQIGMLQHDIKRLETNLQLAEDRVEELASDLDMTNTEKMAMLEDCQIAREEREEAKQAVQALEIEIDGLQQQAADANAELGRLQTELDDVVRRGEDQCDAYSLETSTLVSIVIDKVSNSRSLANLVRTGRKALRAEQGLSTRLAEELRAMEDAKVEATLELERLSLSASQDSERKLTTSAATQQKLDVATARVEELSVALDVVHKEIESTKLALQSSETHKSELAARIVTLEADLGSKVQEVASLQESLNTLQAAEEEAISRRQELESFRQESAQTLATLEAERCQATSSLSAANEELSTLRLQHDELRLQLDDMAKAHEESVDLKDRLNRALEEIMELQLSLQGECNRRKDEEDCYHKELQAAADRYDNAVELESRARMELQQCQKQLDDSRTAIAALQGEHTALQTNFEILETEARAASIKHQTYERQLRSSDDRIVCLNEELLNVREELDRSDKSAKSAQTNLAFAASQHERTATAYRGAQEKLKELMEKTSEMEVLLRDKCAEIEDNDDKVIQLLKEKKKLVTKVESLTKKVQSLQTKLDAASSPLAPANIAGSSTGIALSPPSRPILPMPTPRTESSRPPSVSRSDVPQLSNPRPETPGSRESQLPVFKMQTPPRLRSVSTTPPSNGGSVAAGRKRPSPDLEDDVQRKTPVQPIMVPTPKLDPMPSLTPRVRRPLQAIRSGFTPVRNRTANVLPPAIGQPSPLRKMSSVAKPPIIDVTNSPRRVVTNTKPQARGWLGKLRGGTTDLSSRPTSRPANLQDNS